MAAIDQVEAPLRTFATKWRVGRYRREMEGQGRNTRQSKREPRWSFGGGPRTNKLTAMRAKAMKLPDFIPPQLCEISSDRPTGQGGRMKANLTVIGSSYAFKAARSL